MQVKQFTSYTYAYRGIEYKVNLTCIEYACKRNSAIITYVLNMSDEAPTSQCILNYAINVNKNPTLILLLEKYFITHGTDNNLKPIYDSD